MSTKTLDKFSEVLDTEDLMARCMGSVDFACRVLTILSERCEQDIEKLEQAVAAADHDTVYQIGHRLKGAFANASAVELSQLADDVCDASQAGRDEESHDKTKTLRSKWGAFVELVQEDTEAVTSET